MQAKQSQKLKKDKNPFHHALRMIELKKEQVLQDRSSLSASELGAFKLVERILSSRKWCRSKLMARGL